MTSSSSIPRTNPLIFETPLVSVITPCLNGEHHVGRLIESALTQSKPTRGWEGPSTQGSPRSAENTSADPTRTTISSPPLLPGVFQPSSGLSQLTR